MAEHRSTVLMVDDDIVPLLVLAHELDRRGINLIPAKSVKQARSMLATPGLTLSALIINCRVHGVCAFAKESVKHHERLEVIGIVSDNHQCSSCRQLLTFCFQEPELRDVRWMRRMVSLIQSRLIRKQHPVKVTILRRNRR